MYGREARFPCEVPEEMIINAYLGKLCMSRPHVLHCNIRNGLFRNIPALLPLVSFPCLLPAFKAFGTGPLLIRGGIS
ncbi:hypothetical protein NDU88_006380 [Pleurodeles waltl]|uniref:Uncharacterized protein n=1 Tax=Pleurodeles waltl TaxID=8319 RepID=A0AAV7RL97_PLEWA|nr:hypothetical protein NDU88_006380 [Pleurodeles waltl]